MNTSNSRKFWLFVPMVMAALLVVFTPANSSTEQRWIVLFSAALMEVYAIASYLMISITLPGNDLWKQKVFSGALPIIIASFVLALWTVVDFGSGIDNLPITFSIWMIFMTPYVTFVVGAIWQLTHWFGK